MTLEARFSKTMARFFPRTPTALGLSVSGGGDSTALMFLAADWARQSGTALHAVTIDHGLRPEARDEAAMVAAQAADLGIPHTILRWAGWDGQGNLQAAARAARHGLLDDWRGDLRHVLLGHTMDDQAETFCLNLARGSGVAGLSGMGETFRLCRPDAVLPTTVTGPVPEATGTGGDVLTLLRPLLRERRESLRDWLRERGLRWSEDPSNSDERFDRVRARQALAACAGLGLTVEGLAETADRMRRARAALEARARDVARSIVRVKHGDVVFDRQALAETEDETRATLLSHALQWVSSSRYRPRATALAEVSGSVFRGKATTLHGCLLIARKNEIRVTRENRALAEEVAAFTGNARWDRRWIISGPSRQGCEVRALGQHGLRLVDLSHVENAPRAALSALPALYVGDDLIAVPGVTPGPWTAVLDPPSGDFFDSLLSDRVY